MANEHTTAAETRLATLPPSSDFGESTAHDVLLDENASPLAVAAALNQPQTLCDLMRLAPQLYTRDYLLGQTWDDNALWYIALSPARSTF